jgi:uncharacterized membrane protein YfbV (UPF0208 family)
MGSYHENKDMGLIESAKWYIEQGLYKYFVQTALIRTAFITSRFIPFIASKTMRYDKMICHEIVEK